jgi:hypothetical protein
MQKGLGQSLPANSYRLPWPQMYVGGENEGQRSKTGRAAAVKDSSLTPRAEEERLLRKERRVEERRRQAQFVVETKKQ